MTPQKVAAALTGLIAKTYSVVFSVADRLSMASFGFPQS